MLVCFCSTRVSINERFDLEIVKKLALELNLEISWLTLTFDFLDTILQLDIDVGSSTVARGVVNLVLGYLNNLVVEMAFVIQVSFLFLNYTISQCMSMCTEIDALANVHRLTRKTSYPNPFLVRAG